MLQKILDWPWLVITSTALWLSTIASTIAALLLEGPYLDWTLVCVGLLVVIRLETLIHNLKGVHRVEDYIDDIV